MITGSETLTYTTTTNNSTITCILFLLLQPLLTLYKYILCPIPLYVSCFLWSVCLQMSPSPSEGHLSTNHSNILQQTYLGDISKYLHLKFYLKCPLVHWYNTFSVLEVLLIKNFHISPRDWGLPVSGLQSYSLYLLTFVCPLVEQWSPWRLMVFLCYEL